MSPEESAIRDQYAVYWNEWLTAVRTRGTAKDLKSIDRKISNRRDIVAAYGEALLNRRKIEGQYK